MDSARSCALKALYQVERDGAYSNIALNKMLSSSELSGVDKAFATALFYGVLDRKITIDYILSGFLSKPIGRITPYTLCALRMAIYQIVYMDKVPNSAAVNEAVGLVKASKERFNAAFVNAVLRNVLRKGFCLPQDDSINSLKIRYSCPEEIVGSLVNDYGIDTAKELLEESVKTPPLVLQVNTLKTTAQELQALLEDLGIKVQEVLEDSIIVSGNTDIANNKYFNDGLFYVQDNASKMAVERLSLKSGERVLDLCAAPGGKSFSAARAQRNTGEIISCDIYEKRVHLIENGAIRLGFDIIKPQIKDATVFDKAQGQFDAVICDVPCSGLGVIRRKPEIKYKSTKEWAMLLPLQLKILENAALYTRVGGRILYSTCTVRKAENQEVTKLFIDNNPNFELKYEHTFMPHTDKTDGFYCALIEKKGE